MKKTIVTALIALMVMLAVTSCDGIITELETEQPEYTADGRRLVTVSVNTGGAEGSRSLTHALATDTGGADYYEVIFRSTGTGSPSPEYRCFANDYPSTLRIKIPVGDYFEKDAIVLLGRKRDKTLLATGVISGITSSTGTNTTEPFSVDSSTTAIQFTVASLLANITPGGGAFVIDNTSGIPAINEGPFNNSTDSGTVVSSGTSSTWFQVPSKTTDIKATLTISKLSNTNGLIRTTGTSGELVKFEWIGGGSHAITGIDVDHDPGSAITSDEIEIKFSTPDVPSTISYKVFFNIPVVGFTESPMNPTAQTTWFIRGGLLDSSPTWDFTGDGNMAVPLLVKNNPADEVDLEFIWGN